MEDSPRCRNRAPARVVLQAQADDFGAAVRAEGLREAACRSAHLARFAAGCEFVCAGGCVGGVGVSACGGVAGCAAVGEDEGEGECEGEEGGDGAGEVHLGFFWVGFGLMSWEVWERCLGLGCLMRRWFGFDNLGHSLLVALLYVKSHLY